MKDKDIKELEEGLDLLKNVVDELVVVHLSMGDFVLAPQSTFDNVVQELNNLRMSQGNLKEGVELIIQSKETE